MIRRLNVKIERQGRFPTNHGRGSDVAVVDDRGRRIAVAMAILWDDGRRAWVSARGGSGSRRRGWSGTTEGLNSGAEGAGSGSVRVSKESGIGARRRVIEKGGGSGKGEIGFSFGAAEGYGSVVVSTGGILGGIEGAQPNSGLLQWVSDLRRESPPWPSANSSVSPLRPGYWCHTHRRVRRRSPSPHHYYEDEGLKM